MEFSWFLGVDMSKDWFHYCLQNRQFEVLLEGKCMNNPAAISAWMTHTQSLLEKRNISFQKVLLGIEFTGIYVQPLCRAWYGRKGFLSLIHADKIADHLDGKRIKGEKTDAIDARRIAEYTIRFLDKLELYEPKDDVILKLKTYQAQRKRLLKVLHILEVPEKESIGFDAPEISALIAQQQANTIAALKADLEQLDQCLEELIAADSLLQLMFNLLTSVEGVGPTTARAVIIKTEAFTRFEPTVAGAKSFARYTGNIPIKFESGKAVKKKAKISKRSDKSIRVLLTMGAKSVVRHSKTELGAYFDRKMAEGKAYMSVINAVRNKLILRMFAVIRKQTMYLKNNDIRLVKS